MKTAINTTLLIIRIAGLIQIILGLAFWTGNLLNLIPIHMLVGLILVIALWVQAVLAARSGVNMGFVALAAIWGLIVVVFGVTQTQILPGAAHWVIEVLHLLVGLAALGLADRLAKMSNANREATLSA